MWRRQWQATPVLLPGKSHGWRSLVGCSPWGCYELDVTEQLHFHFSLSHNGEGNGNPLQCSCLENPRDRGAWWAAVYGVAHDWCNLAAAAANSEWVRLIVGHLPTSRKFPCSDVNCKTCTIPNPEVHPFLVFISKKFKVWANGTLKF